MTFKEWSYECTTCGLQQKHFHWDTEAIPTCACGGELQPYSIALVANRGVVNDTTDWRCCETLGHEPFWYNSQTALRNEAAKRGYVNVVRREDAYYARERKQHDERLRDTGSAYDPSERQPARRSEMQ